MEWVFKVLKKKDLSPLSIERIKRYYEDSITVPIVNCIPGRKIRNLRVTLRQGDCPSSLWFGYAIDPLLVYLNKRLSGIPLISKPCFWPQNFNSKGKIPPIEERFKLIGYCDDVKPAICKKQDLNIIDRAVTFFVKASECQLHRDPASKKCNYIKTH